MTLDERARVAVEDIQFSVDRLERETRGPLERFDRYRERRQRNRRLTAGALAVVVALRSPALRAAGVAAGWFSAGDPGLAARRAPHRRLAPEGTRSGLVHRLGRRLATDRPRAPSHVRSVGPVGRPGS